VTATGSATRAGVMSFGLTIRDPYAVR